MSVRLPTAADYLYRGAPYASGYPDLATAFPIYGLYSAKGLLYRHANASGAFECLWCYSRKHDTGSYFFTGKEVSGNWRIDPQGGLAQGAAVPPLNTWVQFAVRVDQAHATEKATLLWKLMSDPAWTKLSTAGGVYTQPGRWFLGVDEWQVDGGSGSGIWSLSNVVVWNASLTDAELLAEANSAAIIRPAPWAWWKMKPGAPGALTLDSSGNGRDLVAAGAPVAGADSPFEAPSDTAAEVLAVASARVRRWTSGAIATAPASAIGGGPVHRWTGGAVASAGGVNVSAAGRIGRWASLTTASVLASAAAVSWLKRWTGRAVATTMEATPDGEPVPEGVVRRRSAMAPLQVAIDTALQLAPTFTAIFGDRVYSLGTVPKDPPTSYVELGESAERSAGVFMQGGNTSEETLTLVTERRAGKMGSGLALAALVDALDGRRLTIDGHRMLSGRVELVTVFADPDTAHMRTVCRYTVVSWTTSAA